MAKKYSDAIRIRETKSAYNIQSEEGREWMNFIPNEQFKLKSSRVMEIVVNSLGLNVQYYEHKFLRDENVYKNTPVQVTPLKEVTGGYSMIIVPKDNETFEFSVNGGQWKKAHFGNKVNTDFGPVAITKTKFFNDTKINNNIIVRILKLLPRKIRIRKSIDMPEEEVAKRIHVMPL